MKKFLLAIIILLFTKVVAEHERIAHGKPAKLGNFPYFVSIDVIIFVNVSHKITRTCGASLITAKWTLTAAHCFPITEIRETNLNIPVKMGFVDDSDDNAQRNSIRNLIIHPDYRTEFRYKDRLEIIENNIALGKLRQNVNITKFVNNVTLPPPKDPNDESKPTCLLGNLVGLGESETGDQSDHLMYAVVNVKSGKHAPADVIKRFKSKIFSYAYSESLVLKAYGKIGDEGSPLVCLVNNKTVQVGVYSNKMNFLLEDKTVTISIYEDVAKQMDFILKYVTELYEGQRKYINRNTNKTEEIKSGTNRNSLKNFYILYICLIKILCLYS